MNPEVKAKWLEALRSGKYRQGRHALHTAGGSFCCLGVLCDLHGQEEDGRWDIEYDVGRYHGQENVLPQIVMDWAGLDSNNPVVGHHRSRSVASLNDTGATFTEIAALIEESL